MNASPVLDRGNAHNINDVLQYMPKADLNRPKVIKHRKSCTNMTNFYDKYFKIL
jgi:hypothetical protein